MKFVLIQSASAWASEPLGIHYICAVPGFLSCFRHRNLPELLSRTELLNLTGLLNLTVSCLQIPLVHFLTTTAHVLYFVHVFF